MYLADIKRDDRFEGYLIVRSAEQRASANGKKYLDMTLADKSGSINAKMWDGTVQPPLAGSIVKVRDIEDDYEETYEIVGSQEANPREGRISDDSPVGRALRGHRAGEQVTVEAPAGNLKFEIASVENK